MESWTKHISGAAALLNLRGKQQLKTFIGHQLFVNLRGQVVSSLEVRTDNGLTYCDSDYQLYTTACSSSTKY